MDVDKIRADIPSLQQKLNGKPIIYFDNACMSLRPRQVVEVFDSRVRWRSRAPRGRRRPR